MSKLSLHSIEALHWRFSNRLVIKAGRQRRRNEVTESFLLHVSGDNALDRVDYIAHAPSDRLQNHVRSTAVELRDASPLRWATVARGQAPVQPFMIELLEVLNVSILRNGNFNLVLILEIVELRLFVGKRVQLVAEKLSFLIQSVGRSQC